MKALIYNGPGEKVWDTKADPVIVDPSDAIVQHRLLDHLRHRSTHPER